MALVLAAGCAGVVYALGAPAQHATRGPASAVNRPAVAIVTGGHGGLLSIRARSSHGTVVAGGVVVFGVRIVRVGRLVGSDGVGGGRLAPWVWLGVTTGLPAGVSAAFTPVATRGSAAVLTFTTSALARRGVYRVRVNAHGRFYRVGRYRGAHAYTVMTLRVTSPPSRPFTIAGSTAALLVPGGAAVIDLRLTNPRSGTLKVSSLAVGIRAVRAPLADATRPCTVGHFAVVQFSGGYGFKVPGSRTRSLGELGFPAAQWPRVLMHDRPVNQDGCQHATVELSFAGAGTGAAR